MTIGSLLSMRPTWLLGGMYALGGNPPLGGNLGFTPGLGAAPGLVNTQTLTWANAQALVDLGPTGTTILVTRQGQKSFGFLPWLAGGTTYVEIPAGAQLVLTGPLTACTVWAFSAGATTVLCHANANAALTWGQMSAAQKLGNLATKTASINAIKALYPGAADIGRLVYAATPTAPGAATYQGYMGFVIGCRPRLGFTMNSVSWAKSGGGGGWTFYFYGYNGPAAADRILIPLT